MDRDSKIIAVGGIKHGQGMTSITYNLAYKLSTILSKSILIIDTNFLFKELSYIAEQNGTTNGIDDLIAMVKTQDIPQDVFMLHTGQINKNLRIVNSTQIDAMDYIKKNIDNMVKILDVAKKYFDIIVIDASAGINNSLIKALYDKCDAFVNVLSQTPYIIDWFMNHDEYKGDKVINVINMYDEEVYPNERDLRRDFELEDVLTLRYSADFKNYYNQKILDPFYITGDAFNTDFEELIVRIGNKIKLTELDNLDITNTNMLVKAQEPKKKSGFLSGVFGKK
ncbi:MAG: hypothetical protein IJS47_06760 [Clostridia bacterium]|nr:hypothetical protein [Clostridia bacterium]